MSDHAATALRGTVSVDGAGITGLTAAAVLRERGARVAVIEARRVAVGSTGAAWADRVPGARHPATVQNRRAAQLCPRAAGAMIDSMRNDTR